MGEKYKWKQIIYEPLLADGPFDNKYKNMISNASLPTNVHKPPRRPKQIFFIMRCHIKNNFQI